MPHADCGLHAVPPGLDDAAACMFSDIYPTSYECAALHCLAFAVEHSASTDTPRISRNTMQGYQNLCSTRCNMLSQMTHWPACPATSSPPPTYAPPCNAWCLARHSDRAMRHWESPRH